MSRQNLLIGAAVAAVFVVIALIGLVTWSSSQLVNDTVRDQFRSQELQFASSLAAQTETYFNSLNADIASVALEPAVKDTASRNAGDALALLAAHAEAYDGVVRTVVRYDYTGQVRYAWPAAVNAQVQAGESLLFSLPSDLLRLTESGDEVPLDVDLRQASLRGFPDQVTFLLIAPVYTRVEHTEFIVYELDIEALFSQIMQVVTLDEQGQLWIIDNANEILYQANESVPLASLQDRFSMAAVFSFREPTSTEYDAGGDERLAVIAPIRTKGFNFVLILSREIDVALNRVESDLRRIFVFAVGAIVLIATLAVIVARLLMREAQRRQEEVQRRTTARMLLEISRALNSTLNLEDVLRSIMAELSNIVPYDSAAILLMDRSKLTLAAHRGVDQAEHDEHTTLDLDKAHAANQVLQTGRALVIHDTAQDPRWKTIDTQSAIRSWMGIPLRVRDKTVGVLNVNSHEVARYSGEEIALAEAFADQASVALQNARLHEVEVKQIEQELTIAREIQTSLLPSTTPTLDQLEIVAHTQPARQVSGDYFHYLPMPNGQLGIAIGDVSGKGIPAALLMAVISTALRDEVARNARPADLLNALNRRLLERMKATHVNSALMVGIFDPPTRHLELANGGMVQPYVRSGADWQFVPVGGYPLGLSQRMAYTAKTITLAPGSMLLLMSDGVIEAQNPAGEFFGFERLEALLNRLPQDISAQGVLDCVLDAVKTHLEGEEAQDDLTILVIRSLEGRTRKGAAPEAPAAAQESAPDQPAQPAQAEPPGAESAISSAVESAATPGAGSPSQPAPDNAPDAAQKTDD